jgi:large subunit ribosomal protein L34e
MVSGHLKSRTYRRVFRRVPSGRVVLRYEKRKPKKAVCGSCGALLKGVPRARPYVMRNMPKSAKRPERPFGGALCSACMRKKMVARARA